MTWANEWKNWANSDGPVWSGGGEPPRENQVLDLRKRMVAMEAVPAVGGWGLGKGPKLVVV